MRRAAYKLYSWATFDNGSTNREWNVYRFDSQSGRLWHLAFDGKSANWIEVPGDH